MKKLLLAATAAVVFASPAAAFRLSCEMHDLGYGFISDFMGFELSEDKKSVMVYGAVIHHVHGQPIKIAVKDRGNGKYRFSYRLNNIAARPRPADVNYTVNLNTRANTVTVRGLMPAVTNSIAGKGKCEDGWVSVR
ncbi:hypothetical protein [uncultured Roseobacter sp.]|uniref:hypothetical protein n=1 Tax=uncultured Roseobacter sp. TaxID=114847 RepID=UPI0026060C68|nr:hypothetical protein [uncultured Roseobacter sp.]